MIIEYARNVLGLRDADHAETNPSASLTLVVPLTCSVSEQNHTFILTRGSTVATIFGQNEIVEQLRDL
jgi:CTP synthase (UTP-ammonia lyase)